MKLRTIGYYFKQAFSSMFRNFWMSLASVGTVGITLLILGAAFLSMVNASFIASSVESDVEISVYLKESLTYQESKQVGQEIKALPGVASADFISKTEALQNLKKDLNDDDGEILKALGDANPLPHTYKIKTEEPGQVPQLANQLKGFAEVDNVKYGQGIVEKLFSLTKWVKRAGTVVMAALFLAAVFLIATTIRLTVFARREEIEIMKFLGATNWFIRWPFLLEGVFLGFLGAFVAIIIIYFGYGSLVSNLKASFDFLPLKDDLNTLLLVTEGLLGLGIIIGALGSVVSMHKYLKV